MGGSKWYQNLNCITKVYSFLPPVVCNPPCENGACIANDTCNCAAGYQGERCTNPGVVCNLHLAMLGGPQIGNSTATCSILHMYKDRYTTSVGTLYDFN